MGSIGEENDEAEFCFIVTTGRERLSKYNDGVSDVAHSFLPSGHGGTEVLRVGSPDVVILSMNIKRGL